MTDDAANLVIKLPARANQLLLRLLLLERAGRGKEMHQRFDACRFLFGGHAGEHVRHGRARLDRVRIAEEFAEVAGLDPAADAVEHWGGAAHEGGFAGSVWNMTGDAVQLAEQEVAARHAIAFPFREKAFKTRHNRGRLCHLGCTLRLQGFRCTE